MDAEAYAARVKGRADLRAIESIFDAEGIDDLVSGPPAEAGALYALLLECARGEAGECFEAICRVAERRQVTPTYLVDRADVLVESAEMRQADDLYRILGVPPLASEDEIVFDDIPEIRLKDRPNEMEKARPVLLEPIMNVEVFVPEENAGDIMGDLNSRRGRIQGMDIKGNTQVIRAQVPMSEMLNYQPSLTSMTGDRGSFHMEPSHYDIVPHNLAEKIIEEAKREAEEK